MARPVSTTVLRAPDLLEPIAIVPAAPAAEPGALAPRARRSPGAIRAAIIDATIAIIGDGGVAAVTHRAVAERTGVSLSSTTYHFASKAAIVDEALREVAARETERVRLGVRELQSLGAAGPEAFAGAVVD